MSDFASAVSWLSSPRVRELLERFRTEAQREEAALTLKDRQTVEREALEETHRRERELFDRR